MSKKKRMQNQKNNQHNGESHMKALKTNNNFFLDLVSKAVLGLSIGAGFVVATSYNLTPQTSVAQQPAATTADDQKTQPDEPKTEPGFTFEKKCTFSAPTIAAADDLSKNCQDAPQIVQQPTRPNTSKIAGDAVAGAFELAGKALAQRTETKPETKAEANPTPQTTSVTYKTTTPGVVKDKITTGSMTIIQK